MHSYRFLVGVALSILLVGTLSTMDLALAGQRTERAFAQDTAGPLARLAAPEVPERVLDSVGGQPDGQFNFASGFQGGLQGGFQGGGFNLAGGFQGGGLQGGFQGGGFNLGGAGFNLGGGGFNLAGGFQAGAQQGGFQGGFQGGGLQAGFQGGLQGGFNLGGVLTPRGWVPIAGFPPPVIVLPPLPPVVVPVQQPRWGPFQPSTSTPPAEEGDSPQ